MRIAGLPLQSSLVAAGDYVPVVDVSDLTQAPTGTTKKNTVSILSFLSLVHPVLENASVVWEGDSITNGFGVLAGQEFRTLVYADPIFAARGPNSVTHPALDGSTTADVVARYAASVFPRRPAAIGSSQTFLFVFIGTNDYTQAAATTFAALEAYWTTAKADGFTVVAFTIPISFRPGNTPQLNRLILKSTVPDYLVDLASLWNTEQDNTVFSDQLHPTALGHQMIARKIVDSILYRNRNPDTMPPNGVGRFSELLVYAPAQVGNSDIRSQCTTGFSAALSIISGVKVWLASHSDAADTLSFLNYNGVSYVTPLTINRAGTLTFLGGVIGGVQRLTGAGAVDVVTLTTALTTNGAGQALTLANGVDGQMKEIIHDVDGGSAILTPTTKTGFATVTFNNVADTVTLKYLTTRGWYVVSSRGAVVA